MDRGIESCSGHNSSQSKLNYRTYLYILTQPFNLTLHINCTIIILSQWIDFIVDSTVMLYTMNVNIQHMT